MADDTAADTNSDDNPMFAIEKLYLKDASFESPNTPTMFTSEEQPSMAVQINVQTKQVGDEHFEVNLSVTITASIKDEKETAFLVEVQQAGLFRIKNIPEQDMGPVLGIECPAILFPYAREAVSDLVLKGGFQPFLLAPVNFAGMYNEQMQAQAAQAGDTPAGHA